MKHRRNNKPGSYERIWGVVTKIPRGRVATYGQIARIAMLTRQARLVGYALHNLPKGIDIPWQRVINAKGMISFRKESSAHKRQRTLLEKEGIVFVNDKIDVAKFGWRK